jgi:hypothetical protein
MGNTLHPLSCGMQWFGVYSVRLPTQQSAFLTPRGSLTAMSRHHRSTPPLAPGSRWFGFGYSGHLGYKCNRGKWPVSQGMFWRFTFAVACIRTPSLLPGRYTPCRDTACCIQPLIRCWVSGLFPLSSCYEPCVSERSHNFCACMFPFSWVHTRNGVAGPNCDSTSPFEELPDCFKWCWGTILHSHHY